MNRTPTAFWIFVSIFFLTSLACGISLPSRDAPAAAPAASEVTSPPPAATETPSPTAIPTATQVAPDVSGVLLRQWANSATASTQYGDDSWAAVQALGAPNVTACEDNVYAWASESATGVDWIEVGFAEPVAPREINIYQSYSPSQVYEVAGIAPNGVVFIFWSGEPKVVEACPYRMTIPLDLGSDPLLIDKVRIKIDQSKLGTSWNEIDAVELVGVKP